MKLLSAYCSFALLAIKIPSVLTALFIDTLWGNTIEKKLAMPSRGVTQYPAFLDQTHISFVSLRRSKLSGGSGSDNRDRAEGFKMEDSLCSERCMRFIRFFAHVRGLSLGRIKKPIIRLQVVLLGQLEVG